MDPLWLLKGEYEAPGWGPLEKDARDKKIDWLSFDRLAWVLVRAKDPPTQYEGLVPTEPADGLYVDGQGRPAYVVGRQLVPGAKEVLATLGEKAEKLLEELGDPDAVLQRLGRAY